MADLRRKNQGSSGDDSEGDVLSTVNITVTCVADPSSPSGLKCRIVRDPTETDDELSESLARARKEDDGEEDEEVDVEDTKKKPSKTKPKKPSKHDDDDDAKDHDSSNDDDEEEDDDEDCDDDDDESEILECVQKSVMKRR